MARAFTHPEAKAFYDRFGARQDSQAFYEDRATAELVAHGGFGAARAVFEFGCGTGRFAAELLTFHLPEDCRYRAVDISDTMVGLARRRLEPWAGRAAVQPSSGTMEIAAPDASFDRFVANYVLDLLSVDDIRALLAEARRVLRPGGLLCTTGLTDGRSIPSRIVMGAWQAIADRNPKLLGGCRPVDLRPYLAADAWRLRHLDVVERFGIAAQVVVAARRDGAEEPLSETAGR